MGLRDVVFAPEDSNIVLSGYCVLPLLFVHSLDFLYIMPLLKDSHFSMPVRICSHCARCARC